MNPVAIILVTYNSASLLEECLGPLVPAIRSGELELIVVDNASSDEPRSALDRLDAPFEFIQTGTNAGFAAAVNIGAARAQGKHILLLNPDVTVDIEVIRQLTCRLDSDPTIGAIAPLLLTPGVQTANGGRLPDIRGIGTHALGVARVLRRWNPVLGHYAYLGPTDHEVEVEWLSGGLLLVRSEAIGSESLLSERWFMYAEDIDLSLYLSRRGYRLVLCGNLQAKHAIGGSAVDTSPPSPRTLWVVAIRDFYMTSVSAKPVAAATWSALFFAGYGARAALLGVAGRRSRARAMWSYARSAVNPPAADQARIAQRTAARSQITT